MRFFGGLRARVISSVAAVTAVLLSIVGAIGFVQLSHNSRDAVHSRVVQVVDQLEASVRAGGTTVELSTPDGVLARVVDPQAVISRAQGEVVVDRVTTVGERKVRLVGRASLAAATANLRSLHRGLWIGIALAVIITALLTGFATHQVLRPVASITQMSRSIQPGDTASRVPVPETDDEIADLALATNDMLDRIDAAWTSQRQFTSDAAHELRTPLMALQGELEIARHNPKFVVTEDFLLRTQRQSARLAALIDDLLLLSSLDETHRSAGSTFELSAVVDDECAQLSCPATPTTPISVVAHERLVRRAIRNVIANAKRHAANDARCSIEEASDRVWVHIDDDGPGINPTDRSLVLQRFRRLDEGRSLDAGGKGLGLAIADSIMRHHDGGLIIGDSEMGGARVSLWLPTMRPA